MVDISKPIPSANHPSKFAPDVRLPYMVEVTVTAEQMIAAKGSALAASDVFDIVRLPAGTAVLSCWAKCTKAFAGSATNLSLNVGYTGADVDIYVAAWDFDAATVGQFGTLGAGLATSAGIAGASDTAAVSGAASVISMVIAALTGTWTSGNITFYVLAIDLSDGKKAGVVQLGS